LAATKEDYEQADGPTHGYLSANCECSYRAWRELNKEEGLEDPWTGRIFVSMVTSGLTQECETGNFQGIAGLPACRVLQRRGCKHLYVDARANC
jgi:hypothetical protein